MDFVRNPSALLLASVLAVITCTQVANAQHGGSHSAPSAPAPQPVPEPTSATPFDQERLKDGFENPAQASPDDKGGNCFLPPLSGLQIVSGVQTATVADLKIPDKARSGYSDACAAVRSKNFADAEKRLKKIVKQYQNYGAAGVELGQVLQVQQKADEAREACAQVASANSNYVPAYLCLADIGARLQDWNEVLKTSDRALEIDPTTDAIAYSYNAAANFNLHNLPKAEQSALRAIDIDRSNRDPRVHFLLAQIYEAEGNPTNEAAQLREYLKYATDPDDVAMVTSYLSALDQQAHK
jgi:tetratricopeptide (TPR) repeat protein